MKTYSKIQILGNIGNEVELKEKDGKNYINFSVAENITYKKGDEKIEKTQWHPVVAFNGLSKLIADNCKKGQMVEIHGAPKIEKYTDKEGIEKLSYSVIAHEIYFFPMANKA